MFGNTEDKYPGESANDVFSHLIDGLFGGLATRKRFIGCLVHHFLTAVEYVDTRCSPNRCCAIASACERASASSSM